MPVKQNKTVTEIILEYEPVELYKILKFSGLLPSGGIAKKVVESGEVKVNGKIETRKRKKMIAGDIIEYNGQRLSLGRASG